MTRNLDQSSSRRYRRIVVKAGTALLTGGAGGLDLAMMTSLVSQIAGLQSSGYRMILVTSGAVAAGREALPVDAAAKSLPMRQIMAAVGQGRLMSIYDRLFERYEIRVAQVLLTGNDLDDREGYLNIRNTLLGLLEHGVVPIINENDVVAVAELEGEVFGDNDMLSAMVANIVDADLLIMLGEVEGLYTADPRLNPDARLVPVVPAFTDDIQTLAGPSIDGRGRGGMTTKIEAARLATASGVDAFVASGRVPEAVRRLAGGESLGTYFPTRVTRLESRKRYLLSQMRDSNIVVVDPGAVGALVHRHTSVLAAGVVDAIGGFDRGDVVMIADPDRNPIACGITNYNASDIQEIRRMRSDRIESILGHYYGDEVIHRDNIVVLVQDGDGPRVP